tara:strand:- start:2836 stop:3984 length:1149 start_codon:yes stop_codon:yes gene_type:complete
MRVCVVSGSRADYGLLKPLIKKLINDDFFEFHFIVTAMHLSKKYGNTIFEIENDNIPITKKINCLFDSDDSVGITKSISLALSQFGEALHEIKPEMMIILGDRTEMLAASIAASISNIPISHIHGGEVTSGAYDEFIRHSITKMSYYHFTTNLEHKRRVIQLGENPERVFDCGAISIESIMNIDYLSKRKLESSINFKFEKITALITFHPVTLENDSSKKHFKEILSTLDNFKDIKLIFTAANSDKDGKVINSLIRDYVSINKEKSILVKSLGQLKYYSSLKYIDFVMGNSSSGIIEVPYFNIPTINIGDRQKGRLSTESVIHVEPTKKDMIDAINLATSSSFRKKICKQKLIYGQGNTSEKIIKVLKSRKEIKLKKIFYDL